MATVKRKIDVLSDSLVKKLPYYPTNKKGDAIKKLPYYKTEDVKKGDLVKKLKKAQVGYKSRSVERSPDGNYKMITKRKSGPGIEKSVMREKRTLKGFLKGAPRVKIKDRMNQNNTPNSGGESFLDSRYTFLPPNETLSKSAEYRTKAKNGHKTSCKPTMKKAKTGTNWDLNKDKRVTKKDILIARGVLPKTAKKGKKITAKKMMGGGKCRYGCK